MNCVCQLSRYMKWSGMMRFGQLDLSLSKWGWRMCNDMNSPQAWNKMKNDSNDLLSSQSLPVPLYFIQCWSLLGSSTVLSSTVAMPTWRNVAMRAVPWCSWTSNSSWWSWRSWPTCDPSLIKSLLRPTLKLITWPRTTWSSLSKTTGWDWSHSCFVSKCEYSLVYWLTFCVFMQEYSMKQLANLVNVCLGSHINKKARQKLLAAIDDIDRPKR